MKISTKVQYGMLALTDIALYSESRSAVSGPDIAERQDISPKYLEQILTHLKQAGLIRAQKGLRGGYRLSRPAEQISIADILNALDNSILEQKPAAECPDEHSLRNVVDACLWGRMNSLLIQFAENRPFSEFVQECRERMQGEWDFYVI